ncbi:mitochondrial import receptor subunit [Diaporthe amygdali]|uniref:mitochondrial import receptor subunit n=1 Tax=Phomopsis amygdali TaxID=1214568 RepID=UPI0022FE30CA|nr:mitochondrial import receptor subunit [Diaporthe amygdali]KAJ0122462.1 mitochondrial import receptor subunit [Diaporthe amygdali]
MVLFRLHVWGPAFGLASIDAECLATITYLANALQGDQWEIVATSPSGVPTHSLPALHETGSGLWSSGFTSITGRLRDLGGDTWDLDRDLDVAQRADSTAYTSFLRSSAAPLVALSLYVSSANWAATTRPAYSNVLPFPLTWTEPLSIRHQMCDTADHLGLSDLNVDDDGGRAAQAQGSATSESTDGFLKVPDRLKPRRRGVKAALSPEQTALFRLEATANDCLAVLADLKAAADMEGGGERSFFARAGPNDRPSALDCLAFGYLALMLVPDVPRPWLKDLVRRRHEALALFVDSMRDTVFGGDVSSSLPWADSSHVSDADQQQPWAATRFARGVVAASVPRAWVLRDAPSKSASVGSTVLAALGSGAALLGVLGSALLYRHMPPLGSSLYRWEMPRRRAFGAAGALFGV